MHAISGGRFAMDVRGGRKKKEERRKKEEERRKKLPAMLERRLYKTTTYFDGLTFYISGQTGMPKTDQSRQENLKSKNIWLYQT